MKNSLECVEEEDKDDDICASSLFETKDKPTWNTVCYLFGHLSVVKDLLPALSTRFSHSLPLLIKQGAICLKSQSLFIITTYLLLSL